LDEDGNGKWGWQNLQICNSGFDSHMAKGYYRDQGQYRMTIASLRIEMGNPGY
jgi:hypothetical protein